MSTIELAAWSSVEVTGLTGAQARALSATKAVAVNPGWAPESWVVTSTSLVGVINVEDIELRIRPRIAISRLLFLLGYAQDPKGWRDDPVGLDDEPDLWPAMAHTFARMAERAIDRGLLQGYRTEESSGLVVRGRLRESDQLRKRAGIAIPLELRFDEYDVDIAENRVLRAATERLLRIPRLPSPAVRRLRHLHSRFTDVSRLVPGGVLPPTPASRLNLRYQPALTLARMVLRARSVDALESGVRATGFLVNMNTVFEDFVTAALTEAFAPLGGRCVAQDAGHRMDEAGRIKLRPDLVRYGPDGAPEAVVDAKYKAENPAGYPYADLYQLLAYCTALNLRVGHLIYAEGSEAKEVVVRNADVRIYQYALDLSASPDSLLAEIALLADSIASEDTSPGG